MKDRTRLESYICWLPVVLLVLTALTQIYLVHTSSLSPWAGGGFGMFSTPDAPRSRHVHAYSVSPGVRREIPVPGRLNEAALKTAALPTDPMLESLARKLAEIQSPESGMPRSIIIEVWKTDYDPVTLAPSGRVLKSLEVRVE